MARHRSHRLAPLTLLLALAACGDARNVDEGGGPNHPANYAETHMADALANLSSCATCHGTDLEGGAIGPSCGACHEENGFANWKANCTFCHGTEQVAVFTAADLPKAAPAGAHTRHVSGGVFVAPLACEQCHGAVTTLAHIDGEVPIQFGALAGSDGATPTWTPGATAAAGTCSNVYCHGSTMEGAPAAPVTWGGPALVCGSCHTLQPTTGGESGHTFHLGTAGASCMQCHRDTGTAVDLEHHVNGTSEAVLSNGTVLTAFTCATCHPT